MLTDKRAEANPAEAKSATQEKRPAPAGTGKPPATPVATSADPGGDSKISRIDAQGHVFVTNGLDTGRGDYGVDNAASGICTLIDNVGITRAKDRIKGQNRGMDLNNKAQRMRPAAGPGTP